MNRSEVLEAIGAKLRALRSDRGLTLRVAYEIRADYSVKIDPANLSKIERGMSSIPLITMFALADYYGVSVSSLTDGLRMPGGRERGRSLEAEHPDLLRKMH